MNRIVIQEYTDRFEVQRLVGQTGMVYRMAEHFKGEVEGCQEVIDYLLGMGFDPQELEIHSHV